MWLAMLPSSRHRFSVCVSANHLPLTNTCGTASPLPVAQLAPRPPPLSWVGCVLASSCRANDAERQTSRSSNSTLSSRSRRFTTPSHASVRCREVPRDNVVLVYTTTFPPCSSPAAASSCSACALTAASDSDPKLRLCCVCADVRWMKRATLCRTSPTRPMSVPERARISASAADALRLIECCCACCCSWCWLCCPCVPA